MFGLGIPEIIIVAVILLLIFGGKRLPEVGRNLGRTISEFRKMTKEIDNKKTPLDKTQGEQQQKTKTPKELQHNLAKKVAEWIPGAKDSKNITKK